MRCPACRQENEPGRAFCSVCARELTAGAAAEIEVPRASERWQRRLREARIATEQVLRLRVRLPRTPLLPWQQAARKVLLMLAALLPGLAHLLTGQRRWGRWLLIGFVVCCPAAVWLMGTPPGDLLVWVVLSLMLTSVLYAARIRPATGEQARLNLGHVLLAVAVTLGCYAGVMALAGVWYERLQVQIAVMRLTPPIEGGAAAAEGVIVFQPGDGILIQRIGERTALRRGDIVWTTEEYAPLQRILAVPGDVLAVRQGRLLLNGSELPARAYPLQVVDPHLPPHPLPEGPWRLGKDEYAGRYPEYPGGGPMVMSRSEILGKAWLVYAPLGHRRMINHLDPTENLGSEGRQP